MLWLEFAVLFVALPLAVRLLPVKLPLLPVLWVATLYCWLMLRRLPGYESAWIWNGREVPASLPSVFILFLVLGLGIVLGVRRFAPESLFGLVKRHPRLWAAVMVFYPVLSVYPQSVVYRAFLMHRYPFPNATVAIVASAAAFGYMHLVFRNRLAVALTLAGGLLFAWRYEATGSLAVSAIEHALYGCLMFTVGLGRYFYGGTLARPDALD